MNDEARILCEQILPAVGRVEGKIDDVAARTVRVETKVDVVTLQLSEHLGYHTGLKSTSNALEGLNFKVLLRWGVVISGVVLGVAAHFRLGLGL